MKHHPFTGQSRQLNSIQAESTEENHAVSVVRRWSCAVLQFRQNAVATTMSQNGLTMLIWDPSRRCRPSGFWLQCSAISLRWDRQSAGMKPASSSRLTLIRTSSSKSPWTSLRCRPPSRFTFCFCLAFCHCATIKSAPGRPTSKFGEHQNQDCRDHGRRRDGCESRFNE